VSALTLARRDPALDREPDLDPELVKLRRHHTPVLPDRPAPKRIRTPRVRCPGCGYRRVLRTCCNTCKTCGHDSACDLAREPIAV
jgi:hypothetical protein